MGIMGQNHREAMGRLRAMYIPNQSILPQAGTSESEDDQTQVRGVCSSSGLVYPLPLVWLARTNQSVTGLVSVKLLL